MNVLEQEQPDKRERQPLFLSGRDLDAKRDASNGLKHTTQKGHKMAYKISDLVYEITNGTGITQRMGKNSGYTAGTPEIAPPL